ncbi:hypothetical protein ACNJYA_07915 [Bradyrhizobium sp. DASA03068]|uniref:hypothetical protein n=1 Tax=Bradyrhizobium sp. BLXBL-01 TaxID=3395915 RepID=UPI003F70BCB1
MGVATLSVNLAFAAIVFNRGKIQRRFARSLPFAVFVLPFVLVLGGIKHHDRSLTSRKPDAAARDFASVLEEWESTSGLLPSIWT